LSVAVADSVTVPLTVAPLVGAVIETLGAVVSLRVTVKVAIPVLPAASRAVTVSTLVPTWRGTALAVQLVVPAAGPLPPRLFAHVTWLTPTLSEAVPPIVIEVPEAMNVELEVGEVMVTDGAVVSAPVPLPVPDTARERVSPPAVKLTVVLTVVVVVGAKRTFTACVVPDARVKGLPETMLKGGATVAEPEIVPLPGFDTVRIRSTKLPMLTLPKFTGPVGLTAKAARATALTTLEHEL